MATIESSVKNVSSATPPTNLKTYLQNIFPLTFGPVNLQIDAQELDVYVEADPINITLGGENSPIVEIAGALNVNIDETPLNLEII